MSNTAPLVCHNCPYNPRTVQQNKKNKKFNNKTEPLSAPRGPPTHGVFRLVRGTVSVTERLQFAAVRRTTPEND